MLALSVFKPHILELYLRERGPLKTTPHTLMLPKALLPRFSVLFKHTFFKALKILLCCRTNSFSKPDIFIVTQKVITQFFNRKNSSGIKPFLSKGRGDPKKSKARFLAQFFLPFHTVCSILQLCNYQLLTGQLRFSKE